MSDEQLAAEAMESAGSDAPVGGEETPVGSEPETSVGGDSAEPFFKYTFDDGTEQAFRNPGELATFIKHSGMRKSDLDREREALKSQGQKFSERMKSLEAKETELRNAYNKIQKYERILNNPAAEKEIEALAQRLRGTGQPDLDQLFQERLKPYEEKLSKIEQIEKEREEAAARDRALSQLESQLDGFDRKAVTEMLQQISQVPEQDQMRTLYEILHYANVGKMTPAQVEQKLAMQQSKKRPPSVTSTPGRATSGGADPENMSWKQLREEANKIIGG